MKLLDFGIAKLLEGEGCGGAATLLTRESGGALTPEYAAPEQLKGEPVTTAAAVYALGVLLFEPASCCLAVAFWDLPEWCVASFFHRDGRMSLQGARMAVSSEAALLSNLFARGIPKELGPTAASNITEEFKYCSWYANAICRWREDALQLSTPTVVIAN